MFKLYEDESKRRGSDFEEWVEKTLNNHSLMTSHELCDFITEQLGLHFTKWRAQVMPIQHRNSIVNGEQPIVFANNASGSTGQTVVDVVIRGDMQHDVFVSLKVTDGWPICNWSTSPSQTAVTLCNIVGWDTASYLVNTGYEYAKSRRQESLSGFWTECDRELKLKSLPSFIGINEDWLIETTCNVFFGRHEVDEYVILNATSSGEIVGHLVNMHFREQLAEKLFDFKWELHPGSYVNVSGIYIKGTCGKEEVTFDFRSNKNDKDQTKPGWHVYMKNFELPHAKKSIVKYLKS